jgi:acyl-CoA synthetase (AMP-forming)/AMP-acid ligase II
MIISGGVNIYPQEAENILSTHPAIADVAVIGVPHPDFGEEVKAVVQLREASAGSATLAPDIIGYCRSRLSSYKCPRSVDFVSELPRNEAGKLLKRVVKQRYWEAHQLRSRADHRPARQAGRHGQAAKPDPTKTRRMNGPGSETNPARQAVRS